MYYTITGTSKTKPTEGKSAEIMVTMVEGPFPDDDEVMVTLKGKSQIRKATAQEKDELSVLNVQEKAKEV